MSTIAENWRLIFFAEGDDATEYLDLLDEEDEASQRDPEHAHACADVQS